MQLTRLSSNYFYLTNWLCQSTLAPLATCQYKKYTFECHEPRDQDNNFCIFHNKDCLKGDNYEKNKEKVFKRFEQIVSDCFTKATPFYFYGYCLPDISFEMKEFPERVYFEEATFYGVANFRDAKFSGVAEFTDATFYGVAGFDRAEFIKEANFAKVKFIREARFNSAKFVEEVYFTQAKFTKEAYFSSTFSELAYFVQATFYGVADFDRAEFIKKARFRDVKFLKEASFNRAAFSKEVGFNRAAFYNKTSFNSACFYAEINFSETHFSAEAGFSAANFLTESMVIFNRTKFLDKADFYSTIFLGESDFTQTTFKRVSFSDSKFSKEANFKQVTFVDDAEFSETIFSSGADFYRSTFSNAAYFSAIFKSETFFNYIRFENPNKITFESEDMSKVSFINTNITRITFSDKTRWEGNKDKFTVIEEVWLKERASNKSNIEKRKKVTLGGVLSVYRNLRENYEFRLQFEEAGKFFIREMELKRKYRQNAVVSSSSSDFTIKKNHLITRNIFSLIGWYHLLSNYGESLWRPTIAGVLIVFSFTFFFVTQSNPTLIPSVYNVPSNSSLIHSGTKDGTHSFANNTKVAIAAVKPNTNYSKFIGFEQIRNPTQWQKAFERALGDFIPLLTLPSDIKVGVIDFVIKIVGGAVTFGLLAIALRRKFERKYTR